MTLNEANTVFALLIPTYFSVREEITTYKEYDIKEDRRTATGVCELYTTECNEGDSGIWFSDTNWEGLIKQFLVKKEAYKNA